MINNIQIMGYIGQDPVTKEVSGTTVTNFSVATTEHWKDKEGSKQSETTWHRCVAWGAQGEVIAKYFAKGDPIYVTGALKKRDYEDKDGAKKQAVDIKVNSFSFIPGKNTPKKSEPADDYGPEPSFDSNEDIPF